ncbi:hypothetical protein KEJ24_05320 [Candidatus Bathyarchaeota archaeon]|nr:hypothetical protein [Candidatus Bathyarchaeota archaeon]
MVTTLIILVVSVLLATIVTFYAINVVTTRVQEESLHISKQHVWYNATGGWSVAALVIIDAGGRDVVIDKISVRGRECPWSTVYYWRTEGTISADLNVTIVKPSEMSAAQWRQIFTYLDNDETFSQASSDLTLRSGWTMVIYIENPDSIASNDVGKTVGITVFTANAQYYVEANVEAT